ncbi:MAG TPA: hypothetical protein PLZ57_15245 [Pseudobdellovibrionaceae bacterium]|nr:hypothetical protein [Pseudobdellovibrionaceae bacterium]
MKSHSDAAQNEAVPANSEGTADPTTSAQSSSKHDLVPPPVDQKVPDDVDAFDVTITAIVGPSEVSQAATPDVEANPQDETNFSPVITQEIEVQVASIVEQKLTDDPAAIQSTTIESAPHLSPENPDAKLDANLDLNLASQITEAHEVTPLPIASESAASESPDPNLERATSATTEPTTSTPVPQTTGHALPTLPQQAISFPLPDAKIFTKSANSAEPVSSPDSASPSTPTTTGVAPAADALSASSRSSAPAAPPSAPPRSKSARLAFAIMATAMSLLMASQLLDPNWSPQQLLPVPPQSSEISEREPTVFDWICQRVPIDAQGVDQRSQQFVSFQKSESTEWQDVQWKPLVKSATPDKSAPHDTADHETAAEAESPSTSTSTTEQSEQAEFKAQAGDRVQIGLAECEVITYGSRAKVRPQQLVQLPQINSPAIQARFFASLLNPAAVETKLASDPNSTTENATETSSTNTAPTAIDDADIAHPLALSLPFVGIARKAHDASRVIEDQLILTEQDLDLRYEPSFDTENGEQAAPSLSLTRYRFEWSQTPEFFEGEARRIEPTSDGRFAPPSLPVGDSFVRVVDLLSQATGPITHLRVLDLPLRFESSQDADLDGRPARKLRWKAHPLASGYELRIFAKRGLAADPNAPTEDNERILHVDETERIIAPLQTTSFFWTVQAIDEQGLPITTLTTPRLENVSPRFIIGDDGNRGHRPQDVDPRGLKISKAQNGKLGIDESASSRFEPLTPLDGEVIVAGTRDTEYGQLTWGHAHSESRSPAAQGPSTHNSKRGASQFELQLATDADFVNVLFTKKVTRAAFKLKGDLPEGSLFFRVRQLPKGEWSSVRKFQLVYE